MISTDKIERYKKQLEDSDLSSEEIENLVSSLVAMSGKLINRYLESIK